MIEFRCPHCHKPIQRRLIARFFASLGGSVKSAKKAAHARRIGRLGGRPRKEKTK